jgi:hypothetical protein
MPCVHLTQLIQLCEHSNIRLSSSDLIHIVCKQCEKQEVCPSALLDDVPAIDDTEAKQSSTSEPKPTTGSV